MMKYAPNLGRTPWRSLRWLLLPLIVTLIACKSGDTPAPSVEYLVTTAPIDIGMNIRICAAVNPLDVRGIWWWMPGRTGCPTRSTGPGLFQPEDGKVLRPSAGGPVTAAFRVGTHSDSRPFIDVRLIIDNGAMTASETGARVTLVQRQSLEVPEMPPYGR